MVRVVRRGTMGGRRCDAAGDRTARGRRDTKSDTILGWNELGTSPFVAEMMMERMCYNRLLYGKVIRSRKRKAPASSTLHSLNE